MHNYNARKKYGVHDAVMSHPHTVFNETKCFKGGETRFVAKSRPPFRDSSSSPSLESRQLVEGIIARVHPRRVSTCVSAEFRRIDTFPGDATGSEVTWENCQRRRRCSCFYSLVKTFFFSFPFSSSLFLFKTGKKKTRCKQGRAGSSWQRRHTTKDEPCSINACTCELPSSRASTLDFFAVSRRGFPSLTLPLSHRIDEYFADRKF